MRTADWNPPRSTYPTVGPSAALGIFWIFLMIAVVLMLDPFNPGLDTEAGIVRLPRDIGPVKYAALVVGVLGLGLSVVGLSLFAPDRWRRFTRLLRASWPVTLLAVFILGGSLYARLVMGMKETYMSGGLTILAFPIALAMIVESRDPMKLVRRYFIIMTIASIYMIQQIWVYRQTGGQAFHEEIFLLIPLSFYWYLRNEGKWRAWMWIVVYSGVGIYSYKNTSYLVLLLMLLHLFWLLGRRLFAQYRYGLRRIALSYGVFLAVLAGLGLLAFIFILYQDEMPHGSTAVRLYVYEVAWERFLSSPIYGTAFTGNTNIEFPFYPVAGQYRVVTHSDFLDVLSQGGLLGLGVFLAALYVPFRLAWCDRPYANHEFYASIHALRSIVLTGIIVMFFNPVILNTSIGTMFWFTAGLLAGLGRLHCRRSPRHESAIN